MTEIEQLQHAIRIARIIIPVLFTLDVLLLAAWGECKIRLDKSRAENVILATRGFASGDASRKEMWDRGITRN